MMDRELAEIQKRVDDGYVTDDDILKLLDKAKEVHQVKIEKAELVGELVELRSKFNELSKEVEELEKHVFNVN